ncbi:amidohydrolase-like protein [Ilyonectria sp. MPI-CAGE-AT-0026]|nr:amidohydrolase-like protein [Ilyonectria sp. MPI-CAGE-AT-0026]
MGSHSLDLGRLIVPWKPFPQETYVLSSASLIDPVSGTVAENMTVCLTGGIVKSIQHSNKTIESDRNAIHVDLKGKYICPGLIDCHVHIAAIPGEPGLRDMISLDPSTSLLRQPYVCKSMLDRGFTTVRDCGGATLPLKQAVEDGLFPGPRLFIAGHALSQTGGHGDVRHQNDSSECCGGSVVSFGRIVDGVDQCLKYTREELRQGADFIKIMGGGGVASPTDRIEHQQFSEEEIQAIVTVASNAGTYVTAHAYTPHSIQLAVKRGVKGIEHGNLIDEPTAKLMAENRVFLTPTLVAYATMASPEFKHFLPATSAEKNKAVLERGLLAIKVAREAGVTICFGTDLLGPLHFAQTHEFSLRSKVQNAVEILQSATVNAARLLRKEDFLGQILPGFAADLLILDANPLEDITVLDGPHEHLLATIKDGRVVASRWSELAVERDPQANL